MTGDHVLTAQWKKVEKKSSPDKDKKDKDTKKHNEENGWKRKTFLNASNSKED